MLLSAVEMYTQLSATGIYTAASPWSKDAVGGLGK